MSIRLEYMAIFGVIAICGGCSNTIPTKPSPPLYSKINCEYLEGLKSVEGESKIPVVFKNKRSDSVHMYWVNYEGKEELKAIVSPDKEWGVDTYLTHPWVVRDGSQNCIAVYDNKATLTVTID